MRQSLAERMELGIVGRGILNQCDKPTMIHWRFPLRSGNPMCPNAPSASQLRYPSARVTGRALHVARLDQFIQFVPGSSVGNTSACLLHRPQQLLQWLGLRKPPRAIQNIHTRTIEPHEIVPPGGDRDAICDLAVAAAELHID
jgi:hypothetical protein